jgi:hypothetical protein
LTVPEPFHFEYSAQPAADADDVVKTVATSAIAEIAAATPRPFFFSM